MTRSTVHTTSGKTEIVVLQVEISEAQQECEGSWQGCQLVVSQAPGQFWTQDNCTLTRSSNVSSEAETYLGIEQRIMTQKDIDTDSIP